MGPTAKPFNIFITSPLEETHVQRIQAVAPDAVRVTHVPDLLPAVRYTADHKGVDGFVRTPAQEETWRRHLAQADILWDFPKAITAADGSSLAPNLKWVQTTSSGVGQLVKNLGLQSTDILVTTARGVHAQPLAEFAFLGLLCHYKGLVHLQAEQRRRHWARYCGNGLAGRTLSVVGSGGVGQQIMAMGRAFGMRVVALNRPGARTTASDLEIDAVYPHDQLHKLLSETDALVLCLPHTPQSENLIDADALARLKPNAAVVNVARGAVVDERALIAALQSGHIGFAALDVFAVEPLPSDSPLWDLPNVLISPHSASTVREENARITDIFCRNIVRFIEGRFGEMENVLDKQRMY